MSPLQYAGIDEEAAMESRLTNLEIRLTHQEAALEQINAVVIRQQSQLDALLRDITQLKRQLHETMPGNIASPSEETPPPHY